MSDGTLNVLLGLPSQVVEAVARRAAEIVRDELDSEPAGPAWMTTEEAAEYMRIPIGTFRNMCSERRVPVHVEGRRLYFDRQELDEWRRAHRPGDIAA